MKYIQKNLYTRRIFYACLFSYCFFFTLFIFLFCSHLHVYCVHFKICLQSLYYIEKLWYVCNHLCKCARVWFHVYKWIGICSMYAGCVGIWMWECMCIYLGKTYDFCYEYEYVIMEWTSEYASGQTNERTNERNRYCTEIFIQKRKEEKKWIFIFTLKKTTQALNEISVR